MNGLDKLSNQFLSQHWWSLLLRGLAAIAFGLITLLIPQISLISLIILFGVFSLGDGILELSSAFLGNTGNKSKWALALDGLLGVTVGVIAFLSPHLLTQGFLFILAIWFLVNGVTQIIYAFEIRKKIDNEWILILAGMASILFGVIVILQPGNAILTILWLIATFSIIYGLLFVRLSFKVKGYQLKP